MHSLCETFYSHYLISFPKQFWELGTNRGMCMLSCVQLFVTPWTVACQAPLSMEILQAIILEWVAISSSRGSSPPRDWTCVSCIGRLILYHWATWESLRTKYSSKGNWGSKRYVSMIHPEFLQGWLVGEPGLQSRLANAEVQIFNHPGLESCYPILSAAF